MTEYSYIPTYLNQDKLCVDRPATTACAS